MRKDDWSHQGTGEKVSKHKRSIKCGPPCKSGLSHGITTCVPPEQIYVCNRGVL